MKIVYDASKVSLQELLAHYFRIIDPTSLNKQGNDAGRQYRTGIYYVDDSMIKEIQSFVKFMQKKYSRPIVVEVEKLKHFILAEDYHQDYLQKNPGGYCHIDLTLALKPLYDESKFKVPSKEELKKSLKPIQFSVTQEKATERPFTSEYDKFDAEGIYVDITTGKPLFSSLGLIPREYNEFIVYWLPRMQDNPWNLIAFQGRNYTDSAPLAVTPEPDSILRIFMAYRPLNAPVSVPQQELTPFVRKGFTLVE